MDRKLILIPILGALALTTACKDEAKTVGLVRPRDRAAPLAPITRAELVQNGATCTPNPTGPTLCVWSGGGADCQLTFDSNDSLTHLRCTIDALIWECTRPGDLYVCSWSDDPGCGDVYTLDGAFEAYLCDPDLQNRIDGSRPDGGVTGDPDAGTVSCAGLNDVACARESACRPDYCPICNGVTFFHGCAAVGDPPPQCPPTVCPDCASLDQTECEASPGCHGVYRDPQTCACAGLGCCTMFERCEVGPADCAGLELACRALPPYCEGPYVVAFVNGCYEGCALESACNPRPVDCTVSPAVFPSFDKSCAANDECVIGTRQLDCCGTETAIGIRATEFDRFDRAANYCSPQFPACECASRGVETEDGTFADQTGTDVGVRCDNNVCRTYNLP